MGLGELRGGNDDENKPPLLLSLLEPLKKIQLKAQNGELPSLESGRLLATVQTIF